MSSCTASATCASRSWPGHAQAQNVSVNRRISSMKTQGGLIRTSSWIGKSLPRGVLGWLILPPQDDTGHVVLLFMGEALHRREHVAERLRRRRDAVARE